jgi:hypothetical protein
MTGLGGNFGEVIESSLESVLLRWEPPLSGDFGDLGDFEGGGDFGGSESSGGRRGIIPFANDLTIEIDDMLGR